MDEIFEELEYNEKEGLLTKKVYIDIWGVSDYEMELMVQCGKNQEITEAQREAYKDYLSKVDTIASEIPLLMLAYYKDHYEDIERRWQLDDDLKIDVVDKNVLLNGFDLKKIFIDRNGNYGWLVEFIWDDYPITLVLSDDKIEIYEGWNVLKENYTKVDDDAFGEMVYDSSWQKSVKKDLYGVTGRWIHVVADADQGKEINESQRKAYLEYLEKEEDFLDDIPDAMLTYYLQNYEDIEEWNNIPQKYNKQNITMYSVMELITFKDLYFDEDGRYGWLCGCPWDSSGLAIILSGEEIEITVQDELI